MHQIENEQRPHSSQRLSPMESPAIHSAATFGLNTIKLRQAWHSLSPDEVLSVLQVDQLVGLDDTSAASRRAIWGRNALSQRARTPFIRKVWAQLANSVIAILVAASVVAGVLQDWAELGLILGVIILNVTIGLVQEGKAEKAAEAIRNMMTPTATVVRGGHRVALAAGDITPGDIVFLQSGDRVPADLRLLTSSNLQVMEAMLTGESVPVNKNTIPLSADAPLADRHCMAYAGTMCVYGQGLGVVVATGDYAEIGKISKLVNTTEGGTTPLLLQMEQFGRWMSVVTVLVGLIVFLVAFLVRDYELGLSFNIAVGVAVALIPEGLPSVVTITLALGVQQMAKRQAIIRQLAAVETLGSLTVICSDKTGTLTRNEMTAVSIRTALGSYRVTGNGYSPEGDIKLHDEGLEKSHRQRLKTMLLASVLCNDAELSCSTLRTPPSPTGQLDAAELPEQQTQRRNSATDAEAPAPLVGHIHTLTSSHYSSTARHGNATWTLVGDPTEGALLALAMKAGLPDTSILNGMFPRIGLVPFESDYKFMATLHDVRFEGLAARRVVMVKGAAEQLIARSKTQAVNDDCNQSEPIDVPFWLHRCEELSKDGLRVLALAQYTAPDDCTAITVADILQGEPKLQLNCLVAIVDLPRPECVSAIVECKQAGVVVKMITGDHPDTARTVGNWLGIATTEVLTGHELQAMTDIELQQKVTGCNIFARASPEHKLRIVQALQALGQVVGMTGDGVNDAPALKKANVGIAMGITGTEVAKEAAKMILANDAFDTIVNAVRTGRGVYDNLRKMLMFVMPTNVAQGFSIFAAIVIGMDFPLTPIQVLWVNMATSVTLGTVLALEAPEPDVMHRLPRRPGKPLMGKAVIWRCIFVGLLLIVAMLGNMEWELVRGGSIAQARAVAMNTLVIGQCMYILNCRFLRSTSIRPDILTGNPWVIVVVLVNVGAQCLLTYVDGLNEVWGMAPIGGIAWLRIIMFAVVVFLLVEVEKAVGPKYLQPLVMPGIRRIVACIHPQTGRAAPQWVQNPQVVEHVLISAEAKPENPSMASADASSAPISPSAVRALDAVVTV